MKCIRGLSSLALVSFLSLNSGVAMSKVTEQVPNSTSSAQTKPVVMAGLFNDIIKGVQIGNQVNQIRLREQRRKEAERRRQKLEAARREATEQQRLEAERRQQYFESLSPEQKETYLAEQRAMKAKRDQAASLFLLGIGAMMFGGSDSTQQDGGRYVDCASGGDMAAYQAYVRAGDTIPWNCH